MMTTAREEYTASSVNDDSSGRTNSTRLQTKPGVKATHRQSRNVAAEGDLTMLSDLNVSLHPLVD